MFSKIVLGILHLTHKGYLSGGGFGKGGFVWGFMSAAFFVQRDYMLISLTIIKCHILMQALILSFDLTCKTSFSKYTCAHAIVARSIEHYKMKEVQTLK